jgi:hypothetical protein
LVSFETRKASGLCIEKVSDAGDLSSVKIVGDYLREKISHINSSAAKLDAWDDIG